MTFQIKSELLELLIMFYCGMAIMLTFELRDRLIKRASAYRRLSYVIYLGSWVCGGFLFCQFLYRGSHGVVTLYGILSMIAGILLWKKIFYGIMKP